MRVFIKRKIIVAALLAVTAQTIMAGPADPRPRKVQQADGSTITIIVKGDEYGHIAMTEDGYPVINNEATGNLEYATIKGDSIVGSGIVAADADNRMPEATAFLKTQQVDAIKALVFASSSQRASYAPRRQGNDDGTTRARTTDIPTTGEQRSLVILVNFCDKKFTKVGSDAQDFYTRMLNEEEFTYGNGANGSVRDYLVDNSNGLYRPTFDVVGPVKLAKSYTYYGKNINGADDYSRLKEFVEGACEAAAILVDYSKYDSDNDGYVDNIYFFYAGFGESDSRYSETIWPHSYYLEYLGDGSKLKLNGKYINSYACSNEINGSTNQAMGIGMFTHEYMHVLGLPDLYNTNEAYDYSTYDDYDLMSLGEYNNYCNTPPLLTAWERSELGWLDYTEITSSDTGATLTLPELGSSNKAYRVSVDGTDGDEFFVLENRQQTGWDKYISGHGMLLWHIDYDQSKWYYNTVNNTARHHNVDIVEACGHDDYRSYSAGYPFPGTSNVTQWTLTSWGGDELLTIDNIAENDDVITFNALSPSTGIANITTSDDEQPLYYFDINGRQYDSYDALPLGIYISKQGAKTSKGVK